MGNAHKQFKVVEAENNAEEIWLKIFETAFVKNLNAPLVADYEFDSDDNEVPIKDGMWDQNSAVAVVLKYIYQ